MAKYRMSGGLAMMPKRDMKLLKDMGKNGWHLVGIKGKLYQFEEGEPCDYDYALNTEMKTDKDMLSFYEASGWCPVVVCPGYQIFRAKEGATPIFTDTDSEEEVLQRNQKISGKWASVFGILLVLWSVVANTLDLGFVTVMIVLAPLYVCFALAFCPFVGYSRSLKRLRKNN